MTKRLCLVVASLFYAVSLHAQTNAPAATNSIKVRAISFIQNTAEARTLVFGVSPSYAPELVVNGKKDQWGVGVVALYPVTQYIYTGIRVDYLGSEFWAPSINVGLKADVQIYGANFTPFTYTGVVVPLGSAGSQNGEFGYIMGGGVKANLWKGKLFGKDATFELAGAAEKWSQFKNQTVTVYRIAPMLKLSW